jgi:hemerythrin-like domain-containing protein
MKPVGPLMWEHRLIEQIIPLMQKEIDNIKSNKTADTVFIEKAVDFFSTYADRTHHGKEEDILFRELKMKPLSKDHKRIMDELVEEHIYARKNVKALIQAREYYISGNKDAVENIISHLKNLIDLYPKHIEKEDKFFFFPIMDYFTPDEQNNMLNEFYEFDRKMIHEKYQNMMEQLGGTVKRW